MKKALLVSGLFSLVMVLTSFTSNAEVANASNDNKVEILKVDNMTLDISGNGGTGGNKKMD
ncbi:hypothetical protein [Flavobacterium turcicum]|uniref:Uncharacterized protein n=1 Tax=Flavobacterium turcicum TaxID=2764718 RepID=A0ABR7JCD5_9FLAO|nr:hypothetical protein [Flavobacterium turcicum]MBC5862154.1 hypothetical protein [Flavobacterium turcicum]NHL00885.1 hypothetical protein [Flavobacterium turcicum]